MENNNNSIDKKYTFWELVNQYKIIIPIIQRDYVQGRNIENINIIRNNLINNIKDALENNKKIDFDFIYGSIKVDDNNKEVLSLLDGQQRITTLFLIHWYFATKEKKLNEQVRQILNNFSYSNRVSSKDFCSELIKHELEIKNELKLSDQIKEKTWYFNEWNNDPTIKNMLNMLDCIHYNLHEFNCFDKLISDTNKIITFCFIPLEKFDLTDELYIKMNSRGKKLTNFEIFKSKFIELIKKQNDQELLKEFEYNIEVKWADLFWEYRRDNENTIDEILMRYIYYITEMIYGLKIHNKGNKDNDKESPFDYSEKFLILNLDLIQKTYNERENIELLIDILNIWQHKADIDKDMNEFFCNEHVDGKVALNRKDYNLFENCIYAKSFGWFEKELLFALLLFKIEKTKVDVKNNDFIRVVRNVLLNVRSFSNTQVQYVPNLRYYDIKDRFNFFIKLMKEQDVYDALANIENFENIGGKITESLKLEKAKAILIKKDEQLYKTIIFWCEDKSTTKGNLINILNLIEHYPKNIIDFINIFDDIQNYILIYRTMLSFEDYGIHLGDRYFYGKRDRIYDILTYPSEIIQNVLEKFLIKIQKEHYVNIKQNLNNIITMNLRSSNMEYWIYYFVKYEEIWNQILDSEDSNLIFTFKNKEYDNYNIGYLTRKNTTSRHINIYYKPIIIWYNLKKVRDCWSTEDDLGKIILENGIIVKISEEGFNIFAGEKNEIVMEKLNIRPINSNRIIIKFDNKLDFIEQEKNIIDKIINI